jgi:hypothetical protein
MATQKEVSGKKSPADIERAMKAFEAEIEKARKEWAKAGETFVALTREQLMEKLERANSPFISWLGWSNDALPGGTIYHGVGVLNPDPWTWEGLAVAVSVGNRNPIKDNDLFLSDFDRRFPTLATPYPLGFSLGPSGATSFGFDLKVPCCIDKTSYFGNTVLFQISSFGVGMLLERSAFFFGVV